MEDERNGKIIFVIALVYGLTSTIGLGLVTYNYSYEIAVTYTEDMDTVALLKGCLESMTLQFSFLGVNLILQGALRALQLQK